MSETTELERSESVGHCTIVGAGTMGHGIAVAFAVGGCDVTLYDANEAALRAARTKVRTAVSTLASHDACGIDDEAAVVGAIEYEPSLSAAVETADIVAEAVPEDLQLKIDVLRAVERNAPPDAIFASNTSSLSITELG
ncbi:MAG: 3-hydroxyacyl-CoA dehydrogenase family protein, partial [Halobacteriota archaeon]